MIEVAAIFWRWNFPIAMLLFETVMCFSYSRRRAFIFKWLFFALLIFLVANIMTYDWEWQGSLIKAQNILANMPGRLLVMVIISIQMFVCYKISFWSSVFLTTVAIILHRIHFSLYKIIEVFVIGSVVNKIPGVKSALIDLIVLIIFLGITAYVFNRKGGSLFNEYSSGKRVLSISLIVLVVTDVLNLYQFANDPYTNVGMTLVANRFFDILFNIITLYMIYNLIVKHNLEMEKEKMDELIKQRQQQFVFSQQLIDSINIKSHDLKKQIHYLEKDNVSRKEMIKGLKDVLAEYDTIIETENEALSTILSQICMICKKNQIKVVCLVNAGNLDFLEPIDVYTIMANILDNAVEASLQLEVEKRSITIIIKQKANFLSIHIENHFSGEVKMKNGNLLTMKSNIAGHGFGMKSIKSIVEKYYGNLILDINQNVFTINILIPLNEKEKKC